jgi:hypothetical protein
LRNPPKKRKTPERTAKRTRILMARFKGMPDRLGVGSKFNKESALSCKRREPEKRSGRGSLKPFPIPSEEGTVAWAAKPVGSGMDPAPPVGAEPFTYSDSQTFSNDPVAGKKGKTFLFRNRTDLHRVSARKGSGKDKG